MARMERGFQRIPVRLVLNASEFDKLESIFRDDIAGDIEI